MGGFEDYKPALAMTGLQFTYAGLYLLTRAALLEGMSPLIFVAYRQAIATLVISPIAYFSRRENGVSCLGLKSFGLIFLVSLIGVTINQNIYFEGLFLASTSMGSAMGNLVPAITFVMASIVGMEKLNFASLRSIAKIIGTFFCVGGAVILALYRGPKLLNSVFLPPKSLLHPEGEHWLLGSLFLFGSSCCWSLWLILQGIVGSAVSFFVQSWCISRRGPLFSAMFNPLCTVIVTVLASIFLHEAIYTGSLIGAVGVVAGLYVVLWAKSKDLESGPKVMVDESFERISCKIGLEEPLLIDNSTKADDCHKSP